MTSAISSILVSSINIACPSSKKYNKELSEQLSELMPKYDINTPKRQAMFIAQCLHESGGFKYMKELWGPTSWQEKYEGHKGLGNTQPGDGKKFCGRGLIQLTGRFNYQAFSDWAKDPSIMSNPEIVETPKYAVLSAIWFWTKNNLNKFADSDDIKGCTRAVNGKAMLGLDERAHYYHSLLNNISTTSNS